MKNRSIKCLSMILALVLIAAFAAPPSSTGTRVALADGGEGSHDYDIMFTKWVTCYSDQNDCEASDGAMVDGTMAGIITEGAAGTGSYSGEILDVIESTPELWEALVLYHIHGTTHDFSAHLFVMENDVTNKATLGGVITDGWLKGSPVQGSYDIISSCPDNPNQPPDPMSPCYTVTLHIHADA